MRIVIDAQALQSGSEFRGIGRYVRGLIDGLIRNKSDNEIFIAVNQNLKQSASRIIDYYQSRIGLGHFIFWSSPGETKWIADNKQARIDASAIYQYAILNVNPDVYVAGALFEGFAEENTLSIDIIKKYCATAVVVYDFIPIEYPETYLKSKESKKWYGHRLKELSKFDYLLSISKYTAEQTKKRFPEKKILNISSAANEIFENQFANKHDVEKILKKINGKPFIYGGNGYDERKNWPSLVEAYAQLPNSIKNKFSLVLTYGRKDAVWEKLNKIAKNNGLTEEQFLLFGKVTDDEMVGLYSKCYVFVFPSFSEGFGLPILEALKCEAAVLTSNCTSMPEVIGLDEATFNPKSIVDIKDKLLRVLSDVNFYNRLKAHSRIQSAKFSWNITAEKFYSIDWKEIKSQKKDIFRASLVDQLLQKLSQSKHSEIQKISLAKNISKTFFDCKRKIYFDITTLNINDSGTGIQRVTRSILKNAIKNPPNGYDVIAMYEEGGKYKFAYNYTKHKLNKEISKGLISFFPGDVIIRSEINTTTSSTFINDLKQNGIKIYGIIYDLIPITHPQYCIKEIVEKFPNYLKVISEYDGVIADSQSVLDSYKQWRLDNNFDNSKILLDWFHLGGDIEASVPSRHPFEKLIFPDKSGTINFICVSTIEPRKGYLQILDAFDLLWQTKQNVSLTIVGREGWYVSEIIKRIKTHKELGKKLFWYPGISDYSLIELYKIADAVVFASEIEGFGLAIIEGAKYKKPLILRDIPVFREIAKENAYYFSGFSGESLAKSIESWVKLFRNGKVPESKNIEVLSWSESTKNFLCKLGFEYSGEFNKTESL